MENAQEILVIIVSTTLSLFLILSIVLIILLIKLVLSIKRVTDKAERIADKAEAVGDFFQHASTPLMVGRLVTNIFDAIGKPRRKGKK